MLLVFHSLSLINIMGKSSKKRSNAKDMDLCFLCSKPNSQVCSECKLIWYCSESHRLLHRPENLCFPFKIEMNEAVGRFMVATRDIQPLELILYDHTLAKGPKMNSNPVCLNCLKKPERALRTCSTCAWPVCNDKCEVGKNHKEECSILAKARDQIQDQFVDKDQAYDQYRAIAPLRLLLLRDSDPEFYQRFQFLMDHNETRRKDESLWQLYQKHVNDFLRHKCDLAERFSDAEIDRACGIYWTNAFGSSSGGGQAVYPTFSFCSHSCVSNANHVVFPNNHLALQAKVPIKKGQELTISYISPMQSTLRRQSKLQNKWFFTCTCPRCSDPSELKTHVSSLMCGEAVNGNPCPGILSCWDPTTESGLYWICSKCPNRMEKEGVQALENRLAKKLQDVEDQNDLNQFSQLFEEFKPILYQNHYLMILLKRHIISLSSSGFTDMSIPELADMQHLCEGVLDVLNIIDPGYNRDRGSVLRHLSEVRKMLCRKQFSQDLISHEVFTRRVQECMILFEEAQKCMSMLVKK